MQKIEQLGPNELLRELQPAEMETRFLGANYRGATNLYLLSFEVEEASWLQFKASVPKGAIVHQRFYWTNGDEQPEEKKQPKGEFSGYWHLWFKPDSRNAAPIFSTMLMDALNLDGEEVTRETIHDALKAALGVFSLSREVSPQMFESWLDERKLVGLQTMSRQITARLQREEAKAS